MASTDSGQLQMAPLRSLDDFLLESARFQLPNFNDFEKWGNRVVKNLVYYQTNYFILAGTIFVAFGLFHPFKICLAIAMLGGGTMAAFKLADEDKKRAAGAAPGPNKYVVLGGISFGCYFFLYLLNCVVIVTLSILLPFCATFVHASLRKRNIKNKVANIASTLNKSTPMAMFLDSLGLLPETF